MADTPPQTPKAPKREGDPNQKGGTDPKVPKLNLDAQPKPSTDKHGAKVTSQKDRQGAVGGVDTGSTGDRPYLYSGLTSKNCVLKYKRTWNFYTVPYAKQILDITPLYGETARKVLTTSMAAFPTDLLFFYMSDAEFSLLPHETFLRSTHNKLSLIHATTSYQTNESTVANATASIQLLIDYCKGAVLKGHGACCYYNWNDTTPMVPVAAHPMQNVTLSNLKKAMWNGDPPTPPGTVGTLCKLSNYLTYAIEGEDAEYGYPDIDHLYGTAVAVTNFNTEFMEHHHDYGIVMLKPQRRPITMDITKNVNTTTKLKYTYPYNHRSTPLTTTHLVPDETSNSSKVTQTRINTYSTATDPVTSTSMNLLDMDHYRIGQQMHRTQGANPWLYAGLRAIEGISNHTVEYQDGVAYWQYECELELEINFDSYTHLKPSKKYTDYIYYVCPPADTGNTYVQTNEGRGQVARWGIPPYIQKLTTPTEDSGLQEYMIY